MLALRRRFVFKALIATLMPQTHPLSQRSHSTQRLVLITHMIHAAGVELSFYCLG